MEKSTFLSSEAKPDLKQGRVIGRYEGTENGPLFICLGAMHGNEPAGVRAIDLVIKMLEVEPIRTPGFVFRGRLLGLIGNLTAYRQQQRYLDKDLNRSFDVEHLAVIKKQDPKELSSECLEFLALDELIRNEIKSYGPDKIVLLDLHTTSSHGGIFTICRDRKEDLHIAAALHAPIVLGMLEGLKGTTLHYFTTENLGVKSIPITFESGQHEEGMAVNRAVAGIINCLQVIGAVDTNVVENHHEQILLDYSKQLPKVTELITRHPITPEDDFKMKEGYQNFQKVAAGEVVAHDKSGPLTIEEDSRILMPLYQDQGEDGYFLVKQIQRAL